MSNRVAFVRTKFVDVEDNSVSWGYRLYDDYDSKYNNMLSEDQVLTMTMSDALDIIHKDHIEDDFSRAVSEKGFYFDSDWYDPEDWDEDAPGDYPEDKYDYTA